MAVQAVRCPLQTTGAGDYFGSSNRPSEFQLHHIKFVQDDVCVGRRARREMRMRRVQLELWREVSEMLYEGQVRYRCVQKVYLLGLDDWGFLYGI